MTKKINPFDDEEELYKWISEEVNEVIDEEDEDPRSIVDEFGDTQRQTLRELGELGWEI